MITKIFKTAYLQDDLELPYRSSPYFVKATPVETGRWSIYYDLIFRDKDETFWQTGYSVGATETQEEGPWEFEDEVECTQVELREITIKDYVPVENE